jgi:hypothetical protein
MRRNIQTPLLLLLLLLLLPPLCGFRNLQRWLCHARFHSPVQCPCRFGAGQG